MKLCRFENAVDQPAIGMVVDDTTLLNLSSAGIHSLTTLFETPNFVDQLHDLTKSRCQRYPVGNVRLLPPVEQQEIWAVGVTYLRSKKARMEESDFSANAYDKVYDAPRPELFFKALPSKVVGPGGQVGIRKDAQWSVPEPELALVLNSRGHVVGYTIGNDMSSRDIEGENLLYLPQAKIYDGSCAIGPFITVGASEADARTWKIGIVIERNGAAVFQGEISVGQIKRPFDEMAGYLFRSQTFSQGAILLTGTGVVPPDHFTLQPDDRVRISISGIGTLENSVAVV